MRNSIEKNRADEVRKRRRQQTQKRLAQSSALAARPMTPITSRTAALAPTAPRRSATTGTQRHYQAALTMPGIEVRMPTISITDPAAKWRLISFLAAIVLCVALYAAWTAPELQVEAAQITGNQRISAADINATLGVTGQPIFTLAPGELEDRLRLTYPELTSVHVAVSLPNQVTVSMQERQPSILWEQGGGYTWIDDNGVAFRPRGTVDGLINVKATASPPSGAAQGSDPLSPVPYVSADLIKAIKTLAPSAPPGAPIIYDPRYGLGWVDGRGWRVFFGSEARDMTLRLQVYEAMVTMLTAKGVLPAIIDVEYPSAPYYRMSQ